MSYRLVQVDELGEKFDLMVNGEIYGRILFNPDDIDEKFAAGWYVSEDQYTKRFPNKESAAYELFTLVKNKLVK